MACIFQTAPLPSCPTGKSAELLNVYTLKKYRKQGHAETLVRMLIEKSNAVKIVKTIYIEGVYAMDYQDYIEIGLNGDEPLKLILCGNIENTENGKVGVVSVVYATNDKKLAEQKIQDLLNNKENPNTYYMVYSIPLNTDLTTLQHYPSIAISRDDFL